VSLFYKWPSLGYGSIPPLTSQGLRKQQWESLAAHIHLLHLLCLFRWLHLFLIRQSVTRVESVACICESSAFSHLRAYGYCRRMRTRATVDICPRLASSIRYTINQESSTFNPHLRELENRMRIHVRATASLVTSLFNKRNAIYLVLSV